MWRLLTGRLEVPEPVPAASLRRAARYGVAATLLTFALNLATRWSLPEGASIGAYNRFLWVNLPVLAVAAALFYRAAIRAGDGAGTGTWVTIALALCGADTVPGTWLIGGPAAGLNLVIGAVALGVVRLYLTRRAALAFLVANAGTDLVMGALRLSGVLDGETALPTPELALGGQMIATSLLWRIAAMYSTFVAASYAADRFRTSEHKLERANAELLRSNGALEQRVTAQVAEIVGRAQEVDALATQLQVRVRDRARELSLAVRRIGGRDDGEFAPGQVFAERFEIQGALGRGGMGIVYRCHDRLAGQTVALKLLRPGAHLDSATLRRFFAEAEAASSARHPGIVRTLDVDVADGGIVFLVMEHVEGRTLDRRLETGPLPAPAAARILANVAEALDAAHRAHVIHRDIKPGNVMLTVASPGVRVLDFGLAKLLEPELDEAATALTREGCLMGTPRYMSPEQVSRPSAVDAATDIYSLGVVLFATLAGRPPFDSPTVAGVCLAHLAERPPELHTMLPGIPARLSTLVSACLEKEAASRPAAGEVARALHAIANELGAEPAEVLERNALSEAHTVVGAPTLTTEETL